MLLIFLLVGLTLVPCTFGLPPYSVGAPWPRHGKDNNGTSSYETEVRRYPPWTFSAGGNFRGHSAMGENGVVYIGNDNGKFYALSPLDGTPLWTKNIGASIHASAAIAPDGTVYFGAHNSRLYAVHPDTGATLWTYLANGVISGALTIDADGTIFTGDQDGKVHAVHSDGSFKWKYVVGSTLFFAVRSAPTIRNDGSVVIGSWDGTVRALNATNGAHLWTYVASSNYVFSSVVLDDSGNMYFGCNADKFISLASDGSFRWQRPTGGFTTSTAAIPGDGDAIYVSTDSGANSMMAVDSSNSLLWTYSTGNDVRASPTVGHDGSIYFGGINGKVYALDKDGALKWQFPTGAAIRSSVSLSADGSFFTASTNGNAYHIVPYSLCHMQSASISVAGAAATVSIFVVRAGMDTITSFSVDVVLTDGTAVSGAGDYVDTPYTVLFASGETIKSVSVPLGAVGPATEPAEIFYASLQNMVLLSGPEAWIADTPYNSTEVTILPTPVPTAAPPSSVVAAFVDSGQAAVNFTAVVGVFYPSRLYSCVAGGGIANATALFTADPTKIACVMLAPVSGERLPAEVSITLHEDGSPVPLDTSGSGGNPARARFDQRYASAAPLTASLGDPLALAVTGDGFAAGATYQCNLTSANANVTLVATSVTYASTTSITCNFDGADTALTGAQSATLSLAETSPLAETVASSAAVTVSFVVPPATAPTGPPVPFSASVTNYPSTGNVDVSWTAPSMALSGNLPVTAYTVYRDGVPLAVVPTPTLTYTDSTALENTAYTYTLSFNNTLGGSPESVGTVVATTPRLPAVAAVNPASVPITGGIPVTVTGAFFGSIASELLYVIIDGTINVTISVWTSSTVFEVIAPPHVVGSGISVVVHTVHGASATSGVIEYAPAPVVLTVTPTTGGRIEGRVVTITGAEFGSAAADVSGVTLAGTPCTGIVWTNATHLTCTTGVSALVITGPVVVTTVAGGDSTFLLARTFAYTGPQLTAVVPGTLGTSSSGGAVVTLHGAHLGLDRAGGTSDLLAVNITADVPCAPFARVSGVEAMCTLPATGLAEGTYPFSISTGTGGTASTVGTLVIDASNGTAVPAPSVAPPAAPSSIPTPAPIVLAVFPGTFPAGQPTELAITGINLGTGPGDVTSITIAGLPCTPVEWISPSEVKCTVNPPFPATGPVEFTSTSGGTGTSTASFSATPALGGSPPAIISVTPEMHPLVGGTNLTIVARSLEPLVDVSVVVGVGGARRLQLAQGAAATMIRNISSTYDVPTDLFTTVVTVPPAPGSSETYADVIVANPAAGEATTAPNVIYYTDLSCRPGTEYPVESECKPCPKGATCPGGNRVWPEPGYWNPSEDSGYVMECRPTERCLGGKMSVCAPGYAGELCGECSPGFIRTPSGVCVACPATASRLILLIGDVVVWLSVALTAWASQCHENLQRVVDVVVVLQSAGGFATLMSPKFPNWIVAIYDVFYIFMGNYDIFKADCFGNSTSSFGVRFVSQLVYAVAIGLVLVIGVPLVGLLRRALSRNADDEERKTFVKQYTYDRTVRCFSTWCQIVFMNLTRRALEAMYCQSFPDGTLRLVAYPSVICFKGFHTIAFALSAAIVLALTIGWPVLYAVFVIKGRSTEELYGDPRVMHRWGNGYILLKPSKRYFYLCFYFTATCVSVAYVFFAASPIVRLCLAGGAIVVEVLLIFRSSPHAHGRDDYVQLAYDIPMAMLVSVTSAVEMGSLNDSTIYILSLVALGMITLCFLFHFGDLMMHVVASEADSYETGVADRFREAGDDLGEDDTEGVVADAAEEDKNIFGPSGLPNAVAMRQRRRSVFEDVGKSLGLVDEDEIGEENVFVDASGAAFDAEGNPVDDEPGFIDKVAAMLGFRTAINVARLDIAPVDSDTQSR
jgi:outer membrane protein assembly factor BamB